MTARTSRLRVTVDARLLYDEPHRGIAKATVFLYRALAAARPDWRFRMVYREGLNADPFAGLPNVSADRIDLPGDRFDLWTRVRLPWAILTNRADVFHAPAGVAPRFPLAPMVATVYDLIPLDLRPADPDVIAWGRNVRRAARAARHVLTASEHAKGRIVALLGVPPAKVTVVPLGPISGPVPSDHRPSESRPSGRPSPAPSLTVGSRTEPDAPPVPVRERYGVPAGAGYVLHFGMADPRKNTARVIDAWAALPHAARAGFTLLIVGVQGPALGRFTEQARAAGVGESVSVHGYAPEADVKVLLAGAAVLCYPTLYEGFGLPVLDGFAAGVPVLTGNGSSLPEVAGDAAVLVDPTDPAALAAGLGRLLADPRLRADLAARGKARLGGFSWARAAGQVAGVFEAGAGPTGGRSRPDAGRG